MSREGNWTTRRGPLEKDHRESSGESIYDLFGLQLRIKLNKSIDENFSSSNQRQRIEWIGQMQNEKVKKRNLKS